MKLAEALTLLHNKPKDAAPFQVQLACGFTPLHLGTYLEVYLQQALPGRMVGLKTGLYGNLVGTVESLSSEFHAAAVPLEWSDLDPRLGYRQTGGWGPRDLIDIVSNVERMLTRLERALGAVPVRTALSLPALALPPVFYTRTAQASEAELRLFELLFSFARRIAALPHVATVSAQQLDRLSPPAERLDFKSDLFAGLPYTTAHAAILGQMLAELVYPPEPKKGIITDLDDTLWLGIVGDAGPENVAWDLNGHAQIHGLYQQLLRALAEQGVLVGIASKNDAVVVDKTFERTDMLLPRECVFPLEAHWNAKSASIGRIIKTWNIGVDSVVFIDDSPMELAEVAEAHPGIQCLQFPKGDYAAAVAFLRDLRGLFGKSRVTEEDALRLASIRQGAEFQQMAEGGGSAPEDFLAGMKASVTVDFQSAAADPRVLELVNKTNQFNLNGIRHTESDWAKELQLPGSFAASVAYEDRFGQLGKIAVFQGREEGSTLYVNTWVMSCRAFARRIEHQCIRLLFERTGAETIVFHYIATAKNGPTRDFFRSLTNETPAQPFRLTRQLFESACPVLYHTVTLRAPNLQAVGDDAILGLPSYG